jgi:hypothetical protein
MRTCKNCKYEYETAMSTAVGARKYFCSMECYTVWIEGLVYDPKITRTPEEEHLLGILKCTPEDREEIDRKHRKTSCGRFTLRGANKHEAVFMRGNCKCWNCPRCGPKKAGRYKHAIRKNAEKFKLRRFLTLTLDPKTLPAGVDPVEHLRTSFNKLRTYFRRKFGEKISYICVLEFQKRKVNNPGLPHLIS